MSEAVASGLPLEVSVSFGKFESDSLSWEKWSSFSPNKYLEEVEKCSTPGSVAQKKAYFEAHYKKIAARKADQSDPEKQLDPCRSRSDETNQESGVQMVPVLENGVCPSSVYRSEADNVSFDDGTPRMNLGISNGHETVLGEEEEVEEAPPQEKPEVRNEDGIVLEEEEEETPPHKSPEIRNGDEVLAAEEEEEETPQKSPEIRNGDEIVAVQEEDDEETPLKKNPEIRNGNEVVAVQEEDEEERTPEKFPEIRNGVEVVTVQEEEEEKTPQEHPEIRNGDRMVSLVEEETTQRNPVEVVELKVLKADNNSGKLKGHKKRNDHKIHPSMNDPMPIGTRKTLASPAVKSSRVSAPRLSSPELSSSKVLGKKPSGSPLQKIIKNTPLRETKKSSPKVVSPQSSTKIQNGSSLLRSKISSPITDNRRAKMSSMHMSLSLGPAAPTSEGTQRKSVVLETVKEKSHFAMRGSLIMDKMGDKEIVKRAFKSFRNSFTEVKCSGDERYNGSEQVTPKRPEQKISPSMARGENARFGKLDEKDTPQKGQPVTKSKYVPSRTPKDVGVEKKKTILTKPSFGLRNRKINETLEKEGSKPRSISLSSR
ncbi:unnamed protein product [Cuscuta campestris]|uniref:TPX2 C-terminal domain-containing protein n=1 Tax=Cuscuta campestris TaxID=132261 RepID=A0A484MVY5_9ASTE|nr:unnamed protein product [Cuscuta campestris]